MLIASEFLLAPMRARSLVMSRISRSSGGVEKP
jgi:hypothetical protein